MSRLGTYLYGVMRAGTESPEGVRGIEADTPVCVLDCANLAVVTSLVPLDAFEGDGPEDPAWVVPRALQHEVVIETMMARGPILPVRFGTLFTTPAAIAELVAANREAVARFLDHVADKEEWTLKVHVELGSALESLVMDDPAWAQRVGRLSASPGTRYFQEKRLREEARQEVRRAARAVALQVHTVARGLAEERVLAPRRPDRQDVEPVLHSAYLVPRPSVPAFLDRVQQAAGAMSSLRLAPSGPWPPSHFCPLLVQPR
ncbi:MAG: GvpL/GvpF family gas vesicle protein [Isosphaerales bacterium]